MLSCPKAARDSTKRIVRSSQGFATTGSSLGSHDAIAGGRERNRDHGQRHHRVADVDGPRGALAQTHTEIGGFERRARPQPHRERVNLHGAPGTRNSSTTASQQTAATLYLTAVGSQVADDQNASTAAATSSMADDAVHEHDRCRARPSRATASASTALATGARARSATPPLRRSRSPSARTPNASRRMNRTSMTGRARSDIRRPPRQTRRCRRERTGCRCRRTVRRRSIGTTRRCCCGCSSPNIIQSVVAVRSAPDRIGGWRIHLLERGRCVRADDRKDQLRPPVDQEANHERRQQERRRRDRDVGAMRSHGGRELDGEQSHQPREARARGDE